MIRRLVAAGVVMLAVLVAFVAVGRWERQRAADTEMDGMRTVLAALGGNIVSTRLSGYRYGAPDCLAYYEGKFALALQLCFDSEGRLVEAVDRRPAQPRYYSLQYEPSLSKIRFPRATIDELERRGHPVNRWGDWNELAGHAHGITVDPRTGLRAGGYDPRSDGAAIGY